MANSISYNTSDIRAQAKQIKKISDDLRNAKTRLRTNLDRVQREWVSDSSKKFFEKYDTSWVEYIDKYCEMLDEMSTELIWAANQYDPLTDEYNRIQLNV